MADEEKKPINIGDLSKRARNFIFYRLRKAGLGDWHEVDVEAATQVEIEFKDDELLTLFNSRIKLLDNIEKEWNQFKAEREKIIKVHKEVGFINYAQATKENSMSKGGTCISASYLDAAGLRETFEREYQKSDERNTLLMAKGLPPMTRGTGQSEMPVLYHQHKGAGGRIKNYYTEWIEFKADVAGKTIKGYYPVPLAVPFKAWNSLVNDREGLLEEYPQSLLGFSNMEGGKAYDQALTQFMEEMIDEAERQIEPTCNAKEQNTLTSNLKVLKESYHEALVNKLFTDNLIKLEDENMGYYKGIQDNWAIVTDAKTELKKNLPDTLNIVVHFRRSYLIVDPEKIERPVHGREDFTGIPGRDEAEKRFNWKYGEMAQDLHRIKRFIEPEEKMKWDDFITLGGASMNGNNGEDVAPGLDENGWPLEVAFDDYEWPHGSGTRYPRGTVLKDIFNQVANIRRVPDRFIEEMDAIMMSNVAENEWDAIRDDLRDGRYHANSLTIVDYIMAETKNNFRDLRGRKEWTNTTQSKMEANADVFRRYDMDYLTPGLTPQRIRSGLRRPTNLIPAFDKRATKLPFIHLGRKFYYQTARSILKVRDADLTNDSARIATGPFISTRGISQYIIIRILASMKSFDSAKKRLDELAGKHGFWYDYGPREFGEKGTPPLGLWD